jgi:hypothetical protein
MGNAMRGGLAAAVLSTLFLSPLAHAGLIGSAAVSDITLGGSAADGFQYASGVNPQQGKSGNTRGFRSAYASDGTASWGLLSKFNASAGNNTSASAGGLQLVFNKTDTRHGTWSVTNTNAAQDLTLDLVFAMHAGNGSGAWLFDNQFIGAGATLSGVWNLNIFNDGEQYADYSNLTLFGRDSVLTAPVAVAKAPAAASSSSSSSASTVQASTSALPDLGGFATPSEAATALGQTIAAALMPQILGVSGDNAAASVAEPASLGIMAAGLALLALTARRRPARPAAAR